MLLIYFMRLLDKLLCAVLFCLAARIAILDLKEARELQAARSTAISFDLPDAFQSIAARDENGKALSLPVKFKKLIFFVVHGQRFNMDVDFWNAAQLQGLISATVGFVGVCDGAECSKQVADSKPKVRFISMSYGDYLAMKSLLQADQQGHVILVDQATARTRKLDYPKTTGDLVNLAKD